VDKKDNFFVCSYTEEGCQPVPSVYLSDEEYGRGLQCFVITCTDIIPIDIERKIIYLARRKTKPMKGWWYFGGKMNPAYTKEESVIRSFKRETGLNLSIDRFKLIGFLDFRWKDREQTPQNIGCHMASYTYVVELTPEEIISASNNLDNTFESGTNLTPFLRERLEEEIAKGQADLAMLDVYDAIFPRSQHIPGE
jgi:ADP-ribose pyrophosphatase YjhB (NUDIX family)